MAVTPLPALTRNYWTRNNVPYAGNTTQAILGSFPVWALAHLLLDLLQTGTASGARPAANKWICRGSSNGIGGVSSPVITAVGVDGGLTANLWWNSGVFPAAGLVGSGNGGNHHWMLLEHTGLGYEMLLNMGNVGNANCTINIGKTGTFIITGASATAFPPPSPTSAAVTLRNTSYSTTDGGQATVFGDLTSFRNTNYCHITMADTGEFIFKTSRTGLGCFSGAVAVWRSVGQQVGDTDNTFLIAGTQEVSGRGAMKQNQVDVAAFSNARQPAGAMKTLGGVIVSGFNSNSQCTMGTGADSLNGNFDAEPMYIKETTPQSIRRGSLPDVYMCGLETVGAPIPAAGATQIRTVIGDTIWPNIIVQEII